MAKLLYCLLLLAVALVKAEDECVCEEYTDEEMKEIWNILSKISEEQSAEDGFLPGVLSPLTPCGNCIDGARRKRTIFPEVEIESSELDELSPVRQDPRCPVGYGRIAFRCVPMDGLFK